MKRRISDCFSSPVLGNRKYSETESPASPAPPAALRFRSVQNDSFRIGPSRRPSCSACHSPVSRARHSHSTKRVTAASLERVMDFAVAGGTGFESPASPTAALRVPSVFDPRRECRTKHGRHGGRPSTSRLYALKKCMTRSNSKRCSRIRQLFGPAVRPRPDPPRAFPSRARAAGGQSYGRQHRVDRPQHRPVGAKTGRPLHHTGHSWRP